MFVSIDPFDEAFLVVVEAVKRSVSDVDDEERDARQPTEERAEHAGSTSENGTSLEIEEARDIDRIQSFANGEHQKEGDRLTSINST